MPEHSHLEIERTFEAPDGWRMPVLAGVGGVVAVAPAQRFVQTATYVDTRGLDLLRARHTLRRRLGGTDAGWHLKKPRGQDARLEVHAPLGRSAALPPAALRAEVAGIVGRQALVPVAVLRTRRAERACLSEGGQTLALLVDDSVEATVLLDGAVALRWREVEVELAHGDVAVLADLTEALLAAGLRVSASQSKVGRALSGLLARPRPAVPSAGEVVVDYIATQLGVLQSIEEAVREDKTDAVHKARVATRRLRSALRTFRPLLDRQVADALRGDVADLTAALGAPRDAEVIRDHLVEQAEGLEPELVVGPVLRRLRRSLEQDHHKARRRLIAALNSRGYEQLMARLAAFVAAPPLRSAAVEPAREALTPLLAEQTQAVADAAEEVGRATDPQARDVALHAVRKRAKAARYAAEAAGPSLGGPAAASAAAWTQVQEALGDFQDSIVVREVLTRVCAQARRAREDTFTYGVLAERETARARAVRARYPQLLEQAQRHAAEIGGPG